MAVIECRVSASDDLFLYKYRQNSSDIRRGASYGWRIIAFYERSRSILYPIVVYPKTKWEDVNISLVEQAVRELRSILGSKAQGATSS